MYSKEFTTMQARCGLNDADDVLVDGYFHGLRIDIQHILTFKNFNNVDETIQHAIKAGEHPKLSSPKIHCVKMVCTKDPIKANFGTSGNSLEKLFLQA